MSDNKKYYYLKLKDNFYDSPEIKIIEGMKNGYLYINILMKMYLHSLRRDGLLMFNDEIPYDIPMLASAISHDEAQVAAAIQIFQKFKLISVMDDGAIYMVHIQNFIGKSTTEADRIRAFREKVKNHTLIENRTNVQQLNDKRTPEIRDRDRDRDIYNNSMITKEQHKKFDDVFINAMENKGFKLDKLPSAYYSCKNKILKRLIKDYPFEKILECLSLFISSSKGEPNLYFMPNAMITLATGKINKTKFEEVRDRIKGVRDVGF